MPYQCENAEQWKTAGTTRAAIFYVAPNPATNNVTVYFDFDSNTNNNTIEVVDMLGRIVQKETVNYNSGNSNLNIEGLQQGTYIVRLLNNGKLQGQTKPIKN